MWDSTQFEGSNGCVRGVGVAGAINYRHLRPAHDRYRPQTG